LQWFAGFYLLQDAEDSARILCFTFFAFRKLNLFSRVIAIEAGNIHNSTDFDKNRSN